MTAEVARGLVGLTISKGTDARTPSRAEVRLDVDGVGQAFVDLDAEQFALLLGGTMLSVDVVWQPEA